MRRSGIPPWRTIREAGEKVAKLCRDRGSSVSELALRFCRDHPQVSATLGGMTTRHQVEANLRLLQAITDPESDTALPGHQSHLAVGAAIKSRRNTLKLNVLALLARRIRMDRIEKDGFSEGTCN